MARMLLVDGSNHAFRVQFALPPRHTSQGFPTRVLYGFTLLFQKMLRTWQPDYVVVSFDTGKNFRTDLYADYKGHRPDMPEDLREQWPLLPDLVEAFGYRAISMPGYEADDVLGTLAKQFASDDLEVFLVTSDKDFCQLVDDNTQILDEAKGRTIDVDGVHEKYDVGPERIVDMLGLAGDSSDNVPGVTGVGVKTAVKFLKKYGTLEGVLKAAEDGLIKGKTGQRLIDEAEAARLSKTLVTIDTAVPLDVTLDDLTPRGPQEEDLRALFDAWEFGAVARKLLPDREAVTADQITEAAGEAATAALDKLADGTWSTVAFAWEDPDAFVPNPVAMVCCGPKGGAWLDLTVDDVRARAFDLLADPAVPKRGHGLKVAYRSLARHGRGLAGVVGDTRLADYVLASHRRTHNLHDQASRLLGHTMGAGTHGTLDEDAGALAELARVDHALHTQYEGKITGGQAFVYQRIELPLTPVLAEMESTGLRLDVDAITGVDADIAARLEEVEAACHELAGKTFNIRSRHELRDVLFEDLGLTPGKKVKDGYSTASTVLDKIVHEHPIVSKVLEYRSLDKLRGTYLTKLPTYVADDGRIHTTFNQAMAATGRLSSVDPNLQNIPVRTFEGRRIRGCFVPADGHVFLSADYSQVELRVLAHFTQDPVLKEGFATGADIHRRTAVEIFGADPDAVTLEQRSAAKAINFGLIYGMSAFRLAGDLQISREEAQAHMDRYFERMPAVQAWIEETKQQARDDGWVETLYGRRRVIPEIHARTFQERSAGEREAVNTRIQGTAADLIKLAMLRVHAALRADHPDTRLVLQVHDELLFEVPEGQVDAVRARVVSEMEAAGGDRLDVGLVVSTATGCTWEEAHG